jgi:type I restriction enzyme S subunit
LGELKKLLVPLPPRHEQDSIVAVIEATLSQVNDGFHLFDEAQRGLKQYRVALLHATVQSARQTTLGEIAHVTSGITKGRRTREAVRPRPFLRAANLRDGFLDLDEVKEIDATDREAERWGLQDGDVLMVEGSGSAHRLGQGWLWESQVVDCLHQNHVFRARPAQDAVVPRYLAWVMQTPTARAYFHSITKATSGLTTINKRQVSALPVPWPSLADQQLIVDRLDDQMAATHAYELCLQRSLAQGSTLRRSLLAAACTGELSNNHGGGQPASALVADILTDRAASEASLKAGRKTARAVLLAK